MGCTCNPASWRTAGVQTAGKIDGGRRAALAPEPRETVYSFRSAVMGSALSLPQDKKPAPLRQPSGNDRFRRGLEATTKVDASGNAPRARDRSRMAGTATRRAWFTRARSGGGAMKANQLGFRWIRICDPRRRAWQFWTYFGARSTPTA